MTATEILEKEYAIAMNLITAFRERGKTDEEILEWMIYNF
jgi:hypothetical protein